MAERAREPRAAAAGLNLADYPSHALCHAAGITQTNVKFLTGIFPADATLVYACGLARALSESKIAGGGMGTTGQT